MITKAEPAYSHQSIDPPRLRQIGRRRRRPRANPNPGGVTRQPSYPGGARGADRDRAPGAFWRVGAQRGCLPMTLQGSALD